MLEPNKPIYQRKVVAARLPTARQVKPEDTVDTLDDGTRYTRREAFKVADLTQRAYPGAVVLVLHVFGGKHWFVRKFGEGAARRLLIKAKQTQTRAIRKEQML